MTGRREPRDHQRLIAESVGTFGLIFVGCGAIMVDATSGRLGHLGVAVAFGLAVSTLIVTFGHISGAHFNPAVTIGLWLRKGLVGRLVVPYLAAQLVGAVAAALALRAALGDVGDLGATVPSAGAWRSFVVEVALTTMLLAVILMVVSDPRASSHTAALVIGGTIAMAALMGGPISGASMNPARTLGPAIAGGPVDGLWIYLTAPFLGALLAVALARLLHPPTSEAT